MPTRALFRTSLSAMALLLSCVAGVPARATSVVQLSFAELCDRAGAIFQGRVVEHVVRVDLDGRKVWTVVRFEVTDWIKSAGPPVHDRVEYWFLGGTTRDARMSVEEMSLPKVGETGIYFVESPYVRQVNPLLGWSQGHFLIERSGDATIVLTATGEPVLSVDATRLPQPPALSTGTAAGIRRGARNALREAMAADAFKETVRARIQAAR